MAADMLEPAREDARENFPDNAEDTADTDQPLNSPLNLDRGARTPAAAQAQRESYLKKGEDLIHSLL